MDELYQEELSGSIIEQVKEAHRRFWAKNMLAPAPGAREPDCPPGTVRTDVPRSTIYDPDDPQNKGFKPLAFGKKFSEQGGIYL